MTVTTMVTPAAGVSTRAVAGWIGGLVLGAVLLLGAATKVLDPAALAVQIQGEGVAVGPNVARGLALAVLGLEAGLGAALVLGRRSRPVLLGATVLVALFLGLTGRAYWRDLHGVLPDEAACGCFGNLIERTPAQAFWQDLLLLAPSLLLAALSRRQGRPWTAKAAWAAALVAAGLGAVAPRLPVDDFATRLRPGVRLDALCGGPAETRICLPLLAPGLAEGAEHWVVLADLRSPEFAAAVPALNAFARQPGAPPLLVLTPATADEVRAFFWRAGPAFEIREAPATLLRPLYRELPRSFRTAGGEVVETTAGLAPVLLTANPPQ